MHVHWYLVQGLRGTKGRHTAEEKRVGDGAQRQRGRLHQTVDSRTRLLSRRCIPVAAARG